MEFVALLIVILAVVVLQDILFQRLAFKNLDYRCYLSTAEAVEGEEIELVEEITNRKWLPIPWLKAEITTSKWLDFAGAQSVVTDKSRFVPSFFMIKSFQKVRRVWRVKCLKRGEFSIQKVVLVSTDLLGNLSLSQPVEVDSHILVLPKPAELETSFFSPKYFSGDVVVRRRLLEDPFFIAGVQEYTQREPINRIHWAATAKEQKIMVYHNECTSRQNLTVILNMQSRAFENLEILDAESIENAIRVCAAVFENTLEQQLPVRFLANGSLTKERTPIVSNEYWGEEHILELNRLLARLQMFSTEDFPSYLNELYDTVSSTDVVIVTAYLSEELYDFARQKALAGAHVKLIATGHVNSSDVAEDCEVYCLYDQFQEDEQGGEAVESQVS